MGSFSIFGPQHAAKMQQQKQARASITQAGGNPNDTSHIGFSGQTIPQGQVGGFGFSGVPGLQGKVGYGDLRNFFKRNADAFGFMNRGKAQGRLANTSFGMLDLGNQQALQNLQNLPPGLRSVVMQQAGLNPGSHSNSQQATPLFSQLFGQFMGTPAGGQSAQSITGQLLGMQPQQGGGPVTTSSRPGASRQSLSVGAQQAPQDAMAGVKGIEQQISAFTNQARALGLDQGTSEQLAFQLFGQDIGDTVSSLGGQAPPWMQEFMNKQQAFTQGQGTPTGFGLEGFNLGQNHGLTGGEQGIAQYLGGNFNQGQPFMDLGQQGLAQLANSLPQLSQQQLLGNPGLFGAANMLLGGGLQNELGDFSRQGLLGMLQGGGPPNQGNLDYQVQNLLFRGGNQGANNDMLFNSLMGAGDLGTDPYAGRALGQGNQLFDAALQRSLNSGPAAGTSQLGQRASSLLSQGGNPFEGPSPLSQEFRDSFKETQFDPLRRQMLDDLASRGILDSSARVQGEEDLFQKALIQPLALADIEARLKGHQANLDSLRTGAGFQGQLSGQDLNQTGLLGSLSNQRVGNALDLFNAPRDFASGLLGQGIGREQGLSGLGIQGFDTSARNIANLLGLGGQMGSQGIQDQLSRLGLGADIAAGNRGAAHNLLGMQQGLFSNVRDFGFNQQQANRQALMQMLGMGGDREVNERIQRLIDSTNRQNIQGQQRSSRNQLIGSGIGTAAGVVGMLL